MGKEVYHRLSGRINTLRQGEYCGAYQGNTKARAEIPGKH